MFFPAHTIRERSLSADLECLCQFLTAVGKHMDTPKAKNLMDQYFHRLRRILSRAYDSNGLTSNKHENVSTEGKKFSKPNDNCILSSRVRFMIEDLIDLRENNWIPRRAGQRTETNKPRFLRDIRLEILKVKFCRMFCVNVNFIFKNLSSKYFLAIKFALT